MTIKNKIVNYNKVSYKPTNCGTEEKSKHLIQYYMYLPKFESSTPLCRELRILGAKPKEPHTSSWCCA
jgi:hypothetical protein